MLDLALLTRYLAVLVVHDDDRAGEVGRRYIATLQSRIGRIISIPPPAHDLTDFWKSGEDLRAWAAGHVARALEDALKGIVVSSSLVDRWKWISTLARNEAYNM